MRLAKQRFQKVLTFWRQVPQREAGEFKVSKLKSKNNRNYPHPPPKHRAEGWGTCAKTTVAGAVAPAVSSFGILEVGSYRFKNHMNQPAAKTPPINQAKQ